MKHVTEIAVACVILITLSLYYTFKSTTDCQCVIGIDLGTAYSSVAVYKNGKATVIPNEHGNLRTPSHIAFTRHGEPFIGDEAKNYLTTDPQSVVFDVMRFLGRKYNDSFVRSQDRFYPFKITSDIQGGVRLKVKVGDKQQAFAPEALLALILKKMKDLAHSYLKSQVDCAVVNVPAVFTQGQRHAVKDAGMIAGLRIVKLPNTPGVATLGYTENNALPSLGRTSFIVVYIGGGSCEVSLATVSSYVQVHVEVAATRGTRDIGSVDFIHSVMEHYLRLLEERKQNITGDVKAVQKLRREVERALLQVYIRGVSDTTIMLEDEHGEPVLQEEVTRKQLDHLTGDVVGVVVKYIRQMTSMGNSFGMRLNDILLFGGGTRIAGVKDTIKSTFRNMNVLDGESVPGIAKVIGAALQSALIQRMIYSPKLSDVSSYGIGHVLARLNNTIIDKFTPLPLKKSEVYSTAKTSQTNIATTFYEVDTPSLGETTTIYSLILDGLNDRQAGVLRILIEYELTEDGMFLLHARETGNQKAVSLLRPENILPEQDMKDILMKWNKLTQRLDTYIQRYHWTNELSQCIYRTLNLIGEISVADEPNVESVKTALRGYTKWLSRSEYLDPVNFQDRKCAVKRTLQSLLSSIAFNSIVTLC